MCTKAILKITKKLTLIVALSSTDTCLSFDKLSIIIFFCWCQLLIIFFISLFLSKAIQLCPSFSNFVSSYSSPNSFVKYVKDHYIKNYVLSRKKGSLTSRIHSLSLEFVNCEQQQAFHRFFFLVIGVSRNSLDVREGGLENGVKVQRTSTSPDGTLCSIRQMWPCCKTCASDCGAEYELNCSPLLTPLDKHSWAGNNLHNQMCCLWRGKNKVASGTSMKGDL